MKPNDPSHCNKRTGISLVGQSKQAVCVQSTDMRCDDGAIRPAVDASLLILVCLLAELEPASLGYDSSTRQKHCEGYLTAFFEWFNPTNPFQNTCALFLRFHGCYLGYSSL